MSGSVENQRSTHYAWHGGMWTKCPHDWCRANAEAAMQQGRTYVADVEANDDQPPPIPNDSRPVWEMVIEDMKERDRVGRKRYGTPLQVGNSRDHLVDAYQEALDLVVYLRAAIEEDKTRRYVESIP